MAFDFGAMKDNFFDSDKVIRSVEKGRRAALSKCGAFVRTKARTSIRYRKQRSDPGDPPSAHRGAGFTRQKKNRKTGQVTKQAVSPLRELIFFAWDPAGGSVVIGPEVFRNAKGGPGRAPAALEKGGTAVINKRRGPRVVTIRARPFMHPALAAEMPKFAAQFKGIVQ